MSREQSLSTFIVDRMETPLVWGKSDCCMFVADALKAMHGIDIAGWFRGRYKTRRRAFMELKKFAGGSLLETITALARDYDMAPVPSRAEMLPGDMVILKAKACDPIAERLSNGLTVGVMGFNDMGVLSQGKDGLVLHTEPEVIDAWRI
jgi:hypothetical protein